MAADPKGAASRAAHRTWGVARFGDEADEMDRRFWDDATVSDRFDAALAASLLSWSLGHADDSPVRLRGAPGGVRRSGG
jgi:hypothetical protein